MFQLSIDHQGASLDSRSKYFHNQGAMGSIGHTAILVGGREGPQVELYEFGQWRAVEDYPFGDSISDPNIVTIGEEIIMSGYFCKKKTKAFVKYELTIFGYN